MRLLDPVTTMARGWSITRTADGRTVRDAADLAPGTEIVTTFARGSASSRVESVEPGPDPITAAGSARPEETDPA